MRDDERLFVGDAGMIVAAGATQKLVESFAAGDSILSPVTASDLDALPVLFFRAACGCCAGSSRRRTAASTTTLCVQRPSKSIRPRSPPDPAGERRRAGAGARRGGERGAA